MSLISELKYFGKSLKLLIVEDEKSLNSELFDMFSVFFNQVYTAYDGVEGLEVYKKEKPEIILTDISMPRLDGIKMSRDIKNINREQSVVVLSAHSDTNYMIELIDIGIDQFILKPFDRNTLIYKLLKVAENIIYKREFEKFFHEKKQQRLEALQENIQHDDTEIIKEETQKITVEQKEDYHLSHIIENADHFMDSLEHDELLWNTFKNDIPELMQLSEEFSEYVERLELHEMDEDLRDSIVEIIYSYIRIFSTLDQMVKMTETLNFLAMFLEELDVSSLSPEQQKKLKLIEFINNDLTRFLQTVFVYKDHVDIYYLEDSLESSIEQLRNEVLEIEVEDDDVDFF